MTVFGESWVSVARRAVAGAQVLELVRRDHEHGEAGLEQRVDDGPVRAFDADRIDLGVRQRLDQGAQPGAGVLEGAALEGDTIGINDGNSVVLAGPVEAGRRSTRRDGCVGIHEVLLAVGAAGQHPPVVRDMTAGRSLIGARWRAALSLVRMSWATGPRRTHAGPPTVKRTWRWPGGDQGCTGDQADTGLTTLPDTDTGRTRVAQ